MVGRSPGDAEEHRVLEVAGLFLRLGTTAFGGPAAHIAMMRDEVVHRRKWVPDEHFLDLLGATNLIPGPNSTEMAIHLGFVRAGWRGLLSAGFCFILPAFLITLILAWAYTRYGSTPETGGLLYGIKPVVIAVILQALWGLARTALRGPLLVAIAAGSLGLYAAGINELALLVGAGLVALVFRNLHRLRRGVNLWSIGALPMGLLNLFASQSPPFDSGHMFLIFLKVGAVLYGSGYVLLAFLRNDLVVNLRWLTDQQLVDAISIGQFTPGPVFTTATFIGYILAGIPGALLATVGIFLPSFIFVAISNPVIPRLRRSPWAGALLDGLNAAAVGLMAAVTVQLAGAAIFDPLTLALSIVAAILLFTARMNSAWLVLAGGIAGLIASRLT